VPLSSKKTPILAGLATTVIFAVGGWLIPMTAVAANSAIATASPKPVPAPAQTPTATLSPTATPTPTKTLTSPSVTPTASLPPSSPPPTMSPGSPLMSITLTVSASTAAPGDSVTATVKVRATRATAQNTQVTLSASNATVTSPSNGLRDVGPGGSSISSTVKIPSGLGTSTVTVTASVRARQVGTMTVSQTISVKPKAAAGSGGTANLPFAGSGATPAAQAQGALALPPIAPPSTAPELMAFDQSTALRSGDTSTISFGPQASIVAAFAAGLIVGSSGLMLQLMLNRRLRSRF
jgi:hypothetical protein